MQWSQLSRPYSSTDQSSSLGSMESLDPITPTTQPYSDSHNSPVDSALFNNKRDSAYSSFSASSNTSDYATVPLRPGEACSMDNLLQNLGPICRGYPGGDASTLGSSSGEAQDEAHLMGLKSRSLTRPRPRPAEVKERPSSCCYEDERRGERRTERKVNPPQPPTRKDSFRATRSRPEVADKRCTSAPIEIPTLSCYHDDDKSPQRLESGICNGFSVESEVGDRNGNFKEISLESCHDVRSQDKGLRGLRCGSKNCDSDATSDHHHPDPGRNSPLPGSLPPEPSTEDQEQTQVNHLQTKNSSSGLHRHSAPEKLLASQLQLLQFNGDNSSLEPYDQSNPSDHSISPCSSQWSHSSLQPMREDLSADLSGQEGSVNHLQRGSRCSTPGSVFLDGDGVDGDVGERLEGVEHVDGGSLSPIQHHHHWGRSVSVPGEPTGSSTQGRVSSDRVLERDFGPLSAAASVDTLLEEQQGLERARAGRNEVDVEGETAMKKLNAFRNHRRNRRRSERFATNLRNEIQRKKAQLQKSRNPGGLFCSGETVQEEEGPDIHEEREDPDQPPQGRSTKVAFVPRNSHLESQTTAAVEKLRTSSETSCEGLQTQSQPTVNTQNQNYELSRTVQIIDPGQSVPSFGVGIRVVEEPAPAGKARRWRWTPEHKLQPEPELDRRFGLRGERVLGVTGSRHGVCAFTSSYTRSSSTSRVDESDILPFADRMKFFEETSKSGSVSNLSGLTSRRQRKYPHPVESQGGDLGQHQAQRRYSYQGGLHQESTLLPNSVEARRQSERERELERAREEQLRKEREKELERQKERENLKSQLTSNQDFYNSADIKVRNQELQHNLNSSQPQALSHSQAQSQVPRSAFYPVNTPSQSQENQQPLHQRYSARSYTPTETYPARQQQTAKLNRNYSLTERDYPRWKHDSQPLEGANQQQQQHQNSHQAQWGPRQNNSKNDDRYESAFAPPPAPLSLRGRAMSENDLRFDSSHRWSPLVSMVTTQTLSEVEEVGDGSIRVGEGGSVTRQSKKKTPPPPRPPPPKWEQFHRRRASHHTLFTSPPQFNSSMTPPPNHNTHTSFTSTSHSSSSLPPSETSRQRSYSLPPQRQEVSDGCPHCSCGQSQSQVKERPYSQASPNQSQPPVHERPYSQASPNQSQPPVHERPYSQASPNQSQPPVHERPFSQASPNQSQPPVHERPYPLALPSQSQVPIQDQPFLIAPPSPMFSRRAFRPVAPPQRERSGHGLQQDRLDILPPLPPPPPPQPTENSVSSLSEMEHNCSPNHDRITVVKPHKHQANLRPGAEWEKNPPPKVHSDTAFPATIANGGGSGAVSPESYFAMNYEQQQQQLRINRSFQGYSKNTEPRKILEPEPGTESETTLSPSPAHSLEAELDIPMETDIDDFQEEEGLPMEDEPISSELPCFALPVTVLETDIDTLPDSETSLAGRMRAESGSLEEELEAGERLEELFPQNSEGESGTEGWRGAYRNTEHSTDSLDRRSGASSSCSSYYGTSAAKAQVLSQMADSRERDDDDELIYKKQLMESLRKKLGVLREAQRGLQDDIRANAQLGEEVESMVVAVCKPNEVDKFRMFIGDLDKVVSLMLSLSGRLLRVETALDTLDPDSAHHERLPLLEKKRQLMRQLAEAQDLKDHVDRREQAVGRVLSRCLSPEQHRDYSHFVKMKAALLVEQRQLEDKIRLGEEQLRGLRESLGLGLGMGMGMSLGYGHY
ncbi:protein Shroom4 [Myripristis murdjan]|nr:protein Shroom4 [Myripristis murdjan]